VRRIVYVSGSRADYGPARGVLMALRDDPRVELSVLVTSMHLDPLHGETWKEIAADGFVIAEQISGHFEGDTLASMGASIGAYLQGMCASFERIRPDIVLVLGDRGEQLAAAIAAAYQNMTIAHLCGGASSGSIDDSIRHAITKFAHYHLPAFEQHAKRIRQLGEDPQSIEVVGLPGGDLRLDVTLDRLAVCSLLKINPVEPYLLVVQHSVTHTRDNARAEIEETLEALVMADQVALLANPNDDAGGRVILSMMREYADRYPKLKLLPPPASRETFASIMAHAAALVGNSSSALVEAMSVSLPVVNIGSRQHGREHQACWLNVEYDRVAVRDAIHAALNDANYRARLSEFSANCSHLNTPQRVRDFLSCCDLGRARMPKSFFAFGE
jgi:UDP-N-acetylglucosamine 2-epimerase (non-hydrolysing)/GDP/UDP-N,N'-diacetylbacillosamine 2-epimerase (hydrolysing)